MHRWRSMVPMVASVLLRHQASASPAPQYRNNRLSNSNFTPSTRFLPKFEIHDVRDEPTYGAMTRVAVDGKQLLISQFPQLGPRKMDPNDIAPQFDADRRISLRFRHTDFAGMVAVTDDRAPQYHMKNNAYDLIFERTATGFALKGQVRRVQSQNQEEWALHFDHQFAVTLKHFLASGLTESFGFQAFHESQRAQERSGGNSSSSAQRSARSGNSQRQQ